MIVSTLRRAAVDGERLPSGVAAGESSVTIIADDLRPMTFDDERSGATCPKTPASLGAPCCISMTRASWRS